MSNLPITVLGPGSWGTALALVLSRNGHAVRLWGNVPEELDALRRNRENRTFLPGIPFPETLEVVDTLETALNGVRDILLVVPSQAFHSVLEAIKATGIAAPRIAWGTKGIDAATGAFLHDLVVKVLGETTSRALLAGPSFAKEVAAGKPTCINIACNDEAFARDLRVRFNNAVFSLKSCNDFVGMALCSVAKNVIAIAVGLLDGLGYGANARAALITQGLSEMVALSVALGGQSQTVLDLAGVGDLVLTCTDNQSRNRRFGLALGEGKTVEQAFAVIGQEVEGYHNAAQLYALTQKAAGSFPLIDAINSILNDAENPEQLLLLLLDR